MSDGYKHYIRPASDGIIRYGFCDVQEAPQQGDLLIEDNAPRQFNLQLLNGKLQFIYKIANGQMVERTAEELFDLSSYKQDKINLLSGICRSVILADFTSSALGVPHQYGFSTDDQANISGVVTAINANLCPPTVKWRTNDAGVFVHTIDQLKVLFTDGFIHKQTKLDKYGALKDQINDVATDTKDKVDTIVASW